jgi:hypothetical protein
MPERRKCWSCGTEQVYLGEGDTCYKCGALLFHSEPERRRYRDILLCKMAEELEEEQSLV